MTTKQRNLLLSLRRERTRLVAHLVKLNRQAPSELVNIGVGNCQRELARVNEKIHRVEENCR